MKKNNKSKRRDSKGRILRTGESQREDGTYDYCYMDKDHKRRSIYAATLEELRKKEDALTASKTKNGERFVPMSPEVTGSITLSIFVPSTIKSTEFSFRRSRPMCADTPSAPTWRALAWT